MCRLYELLSGTHMVHHHFRLSREALSDLCLWATFIESWNGVGMMRESSEAQVLTHSIRQLWMWCTGHLLVLVSATMTVNLHLRMGGLKG